MSKKPLIGITLDWEEAGGFARTPWYAVRQNYCTSISALGGIPLPLPHEGDLIDNFLDLIDGLLITGGGHDVSPHLYGEEHIHPSVTLKPTRTAFELAIVTAALERDMPVLGICGGQQLLNVALGGSLIQHVPDLNSPIEHKCTEPAYAIAHPIQIEKETLLHRLIGKDVINVNSVHHQAVRTLGEDLVINALAPDGIIEGIESSRHRFCLGLQWHPECTFSDLEKKIFEAFIHAARSSR